MAFWVSNPEWRSRDGGSGSLVMPPYLRENAGRAPTFLSYTLASALQLRKNHGKTSVRVGEKCQLSTIRLVYRAAVIASAIESVTLDTLGLRFR
jgi:hypothetical protein